MVHDCVFYGLFGDLIPARALDQGEDLEWRRARQGLVPDFRLRLPSPEGLTEHLAELKFIGAGVSLFLRGVVGKGADRRAGGLPKLKLYKRKQLPLDARFHNTPLVRRLESFGKLEGLLMKGFELATCGSAF